MFFSKGRTLSGSHPLSRTIAHTYVWACATWVGVYARGLALGLGLFMKWKGKLSVVSARDGSALVLELQSDKRNGIVDLVAARLRDSEGGCTVVLQIEETGVGTGESAK